MIIPTCGKKIHSDSSPRKHVPNLVIAHRVSGFTAFKKVEIVDPFEEFIFEGESCVEEFCKWLFTEANKYSVIMAHNFSGYDSFFIIRWLICQKKNVCYIPKGPRYLMVELKDIHSIIIDSLSFFPVPTVLT